jgi:hypothetical protein
MSCNKTQQVLIPKQDLAQGTISPPVQPNSTIIPEVKPNTTTSRYPKTKNALRNAAIIVFVEVMYAYVCMKGVMSLAGTCYGNSPMYGKTKDSLLALGGIIRSCIYAGLAYTLPAAACYACTEENKKDE